MSKKKKQAQLEQQIKAEKESQRQKDLDIIKAYEMKTTPIPGAKIYRYIDTRKQLIYGTREQLIRLQHLCKFGWSLIEINEGNRVIDLEPDFSS